MKIVEHFNFSYKKQEKKIKNLIERIIKIHSENRKNCH